MRRQRDWRQRLIAYLDAAARRRFEPGAIDCALFTAGAVEAMTGEDPAAGLRGAYRTLREGYDLLQARGYADQIALAASLFEEVPPAMAWPGDLAVVNTPEGLALGVVQGQGVYVMTHGGLGLEPRTAALRAFRVRVN